MHADKCWFDWPSAGHSAGLGDHFDVRKIPCVSADPLVQADEHAHSYGTICCSELQATGLGYWGVRDHNHAKDTVVSHCNYGKSHPHLQDILLGVVGRSLERLGLAAHSLDANWWDIEGVEQVDSWAVDIHSFYNPPIEHCNPYRAVRSACCPHSKKSCRSSESTGRTQNVHPLDRLE